MGKKPKPETDVNPNVPLLFEETHAELTHLAASLDQVSKDSARAAGMAHGIKLAAETIVNAARRHGVL